MTGIVVDLATEKRIATANSESDASKWEPRDVLVQMLRDIDSGKAKPTALVVAWLELAPDDMVLCNFLISTEDIYKSTFLVEKLKQEIWDNARA